MLRLAVIVLSCCLRLSTEENIIYVPVPASDMPAVNANDFEQGAPNSYSIQSEIIKLQQPAAIRQTLPSLGLQPTEQFARRPDTTRDVVYIPVPKPARKQSDVVFLPKPQYAEDPRLGNPMNPPTFKQFPRLPTVPRSSSPSTPPLSCPASDSQAAAAPQITYIQLPNIPPPPPPVVYRPVPSPPVYVPVMATPTRVASSLTQSENASAEVGEPKIKKDGGGREIRIESDHEIVKVDEGQTSGRKKKRISRERRGLNRDNYT